MRTNAHLRVLTALFALALVAAACGESNAPTTTDASNTDASESTTTHSDVHDGGDDDGHHHDHDAELAESVHDENGDDDGNGHHHDAPVDADAANPPTIAVEVDADPAGGINIHVTTTGFDVVPEAASTDHIDGEGHFHLWIDGEKVLRFYNESVYFAGVTEGEVEVMVELSANDHRQYVVDGEPIVAMTTFTVPPHDHGAHSHGAADSIAWEGEAPALAVEVVEDPKSGFNAFVTVDGLTLSADNVGGPNVDGEGHLHIYANGQKLGRLYGTATHIPALPEGDVEITVGAFSNDHSPYVIDGEPVEASTTITVAS